MFRHFIATTSLMCIGIIALSLYALNVADAQDTSRPLDYPTNDSNYGDFGAGELGNYDEGPVERPPKTPMGVGAEMKVDEPAPKPRPPSPRIRRNSSDNPDWANALVEVQGEDFVRDPGTNELELASYKRRRKTLGLIFSFGLSTYRPAMVKSGVTTLGDAMDYGQPETNLLEVQFGPKWNFPFGSIAGDIGFGQYYDQAHGPLYDSSLTVNIVRLGVTFNFDTLFSVPYVVPYVAAGAYQAIYTEEGGGDSTFSGVIDNKGTEPIAPYIAGGVNLQLNWLDRRTAKGAWQDLGMLNGFIYLEARHMMPATSGFADMSSSGVDFSSGVRVEF